MLHHIFVMSFSQSLRAQGAFQVSMADKSGPERGINCTAKQYLCNKENSTTDSSKHFPVRTPQILKPLKKFKDSADALSSNSLLLRP